MQIINILVLQFSEMGGVTQNEGLFLKWGGVLTPLRTMVMLVGLSLAIMQVTVFVAIMKLDVFAALMQVTVSAANMWVTIFIVIMQVGVSIANYAGDIFCSALCK